MQLISIIYFLLLKLRYKFNIIGLEKIEKNKKYVIFPNHEALVDPQIVISLIGQKIKVSPVVSETFYNLPILKTFLKLMGAVPMGDLQKGTSTQEDVKNAFKNIEIALKGGKNILLYPAGQLYSQGYEIIKGKKGAYNLVQTLDKETEILVIRTTGLWGSMWSKSWIGYTPNAFMTLIRSIFIIISNFIFFVPKRQVHIEISNYTKKLKNIKDLDKFNQILEDFYNQNGKEEVNYNKHFFYYDNVKNKTIPKIKGSIEDSSSIIDEKLIPKEVLEKINKKILEMKSKNTPIPTFPLQGERSKEFSISSRLIFDLYFDSLDTAEIKSFIQINFPNSSNPPITELKTIGDLCYMAIGKSDSNEEIKPCNWQNINDNEKTIFEIISTNKNKLGNDANILSLFKEIFKNNKQDDFVYDTIFGLQSKKDFVLKAYLISNFIKKIDGKYIGVMIPSISSASLLIISIYLAGKIPVMLNWTVGETALLHCIKFANIDNILTSKNFYQKIKNDSTEKIKEKYVFLEELLKDISIGNKLKALFCSMIFKIPKISFEDEAVLLFTSGSESLPKAVSLTHKNLISNIIGALYHFPIAKKDILIGFLPPFHSFGFTINTIMPLLSGLRVVYTPDPNDSKTIANLINFCASTTLTATPTFLKMILAVSEQKDLESLNYAVVGAEKCPETLALNFAKYCPNGKILEGYGITECSPVISINPISKPKLGSVGLPIFGSDVIIQSLENINISLGANKEGMIYFAGDNVFNGYLDKNLENPFENIILNTSPQPSPLEEREIKGEISKKYYKTGDLGYLDDEGYLYITGRLKRFIKIAGEMISLPFIEGILNKKYGSDTEIKLAIEALEKDFNAKIVLFSIVDLNLEEINEYLRNSGVSNLVKISEIIKIESIGVLGTGKIDYKVLKAMIKL